MRQLIGYAMSALVMVTVGYAFAPRSPAPLAETRLHADRVQINDMLVNDRQLVAVGERGTILTSADHGLSWQSAVVEPQRAISLTGVTALSDQVLLAVGHDGWILRSEDAGANWHEVGYDAESGEPLLGVWSADGHKVAAFGSYGRFFESDDGGRSWTPREVNPDGLHLNGMDGDVDGRRMLVGEQGLVMRSNDDGATWENLTPFYNGSLFGVVRLSDENWLVYGMRGHVFRTDDFGRSWQRVGLDHHNPLYGHVLLPDGGLVLVGADSSVVHLDASGKLLDSSRRSGLGTLTSAAAPSQRLVLFGGERGVFQGADEHLAAGH
ncbi:YCF48-related protein [Pseudomonas sp. H9]|uniref:WD40/YVTN/BNR-like repeat-containing protein n=1 Tax=Pseudomonas sp. H9 TaxID=483968 RepID=UPI00105821A4|nr:YCF48-related protein [Pseudomonas sp. H9]TDF85965.1 glycosyl hydrolase [Pseudomonas sp. H9]